MAYCQKCGAHAEEGRKYCPECGAAMEEHVGRPADTADSDAQQNRAMGILAYISLLVLVPIFAARDSKFARFHANQGLVLAVIEVAYWIICAIINAVIYSISWRLGFISVILSLVNILFTVLAVMGIVNAARGQMKPLPVIGGIKILK